MFRTLRAPYQYYITMTTHGKGMNGGKSMISPHFVNKSLCYGGNMYLHIALNSSRSHTLKYIHSDMLAESNTQYDNTVYVVRNVSGK